jgi:hypothetical protein
MGTLSISTATPRRPTGRLYVALGVAVALLGPALYVWQILGARWLRDPWYVPVSATLGVALLLVALGRARSVWRILALVLVGLLAAGEWYFLLVLARLPDYTGPVVVGRPFPPFTTTRAGGSSFDQDSLKGEQNTVMVFFRGRW